MWGKAFTILASLRLQLLGPFGQEATGRTHCGGRETVTLWANAFFFGHECRLLANVERMSYRAQRSAY